jgi:hypothetical protein
VLFFSELNIILDKACSIHLQVPKAHCSFISKALVISDLVVPREVILSLSISKSKLVLLIL